MGAGAFVRVAAFAAVLALAGLSAGAEPVGFVAVTEGPVEIRSGPAGAFHAAVVDDEFAVGDTIRTGRNGLAKLVLSDDTLITVDEETELAIDQWVVGARAGGEPSRIDLLSGHIRTVVGETFGGESRIQIRTPTAVMGVKGTDWLTWYRNAVTWACVVSGIVNTAGRAVAADAIDLVAGDCARIAKHKGPELRRPPEDLEPAEEARGLAPAFPAKLDASAPPPAFERPVIEPGDNVGRELEVPTPEPQPSAPAVPPPAPEPPLRQEPPSPPPSFSKG